MIVWGKPERDPIRNKTGMRIGHYSIIRSTEPVGYTISLIPNVEKVRFCCFFTRREHDFDFIGETENLWREDDTAKRDAVAKLRELAEAHATAAIQNASPAPG